MNAELWEIVIEPGQEVIRLLEHLLGAQPASAEITSGAAAPPGPEALDRLRTELRTLLEELRAKLARFLTEKECGLVLFPLVIHLDELVMQRLGCYPQVSWPLLQQDLFNVNDGGSQFYQFVEERLHKADTPPLVYEVLYYCLSDGFVGKHALDPGQIDKYRVELLERLQIPELPGDKSKARRRKRREEAESPDASGVLRKKKTTLLAAPEQLDRRAIAAPWFYLFTAVGLVLASLAFALLSNL